MTQPSIWAATALTDNGWRSDVRVTWLTDGVIASLEVGATPRACDQRVGILLPALANLHSHAFQRAMAGLGERRHPDSQDSFWTWRQLMYRFLQHLTPDDIETIAAFVQMEMLERGYAAVGEFHYLHHQPNGKPYDNIAELSERISAAAMTTGIGLTLLPVFYQQGGCDGRPIDSGQLRFGNEPDRYVKLFDGAQEAVQALPPDSLIGVAPHSLRAVSGEGLTFAAELAGARPLHIHIAEQTAEVDEVHATLGQRPVQWLLSHHNVDERWCLIHATHMTADETQSLAASRAVTGLCPQTEANLGDGIFDAVNYLAAGGRFGIGSDSNIRITLTEELRLLEYSQRLRDRGRARLASPLASTGRVLFEAAARGGTQALGRHGSRIRTGWLADFIALDNTATDLLGRTGDEILDSFIFASDERIITDVWSAGRHLVHKGLHRDRDLITKRYRNTLLSLKKRL